MPKFNKAQYTLRESYKFYAESEKNPVSYKEFKLILDTWGNIVVDYLVEGKDVKLHEGLSVLGVRKFHKKVFRDHKASNELGEPVMSSNIHSGFYGASVWWRRHYTRFNSVGWSFEPTRTLSRRLASVMKEYLGHTKFSQKMFATNSAEQAKIMYNKKVLKV